MRIKVVKSSTLMFEKLADGSSIVFDHEADCAHALNPAATKVWEGFVDGGTEGSVRSTLTATVGRDVDEAAVYNTLAQFRDAGLIETDEDSRLVAHASRRDTLRRLSLGLALAMAFPLIETLTGSEQRAYAQRAGSTRPMLLGPPDQKD